MSLSPLSRRFVILVLACFISSVTSPVRAQVPDPTIAAQAPQPGVGHHYIGNGSEAVNPADGSPSFDLPLQPPAGRGLSARFGIRFSGSEQFYLSNRTTANQNLVWTPNWEPSGQAPWQVGAWSYDLPILTATTSIFWSATTPNNGCPNGVCTYSTNYCYGNDSYVFRGLDGVQYSVPLGSVFPDPNNQQQGFCPAPPNNVKSPGNNHGILSTFQSSSLTTVVDQSGTTYQFPVGSGQPMEPIIPPANPIMWGDLATSITDRNGNQLTLSGNSYKDPTGRTALLWTGIGNSGDQITVSGLGGPITLNWTTTPVSYPETGYNSGYTLTPCALNGGTANSVSVVSEIDLPSGRKYTFQYDGTYGKVSKITFPDGGYVRYAWGLYRSAMAMHASWTVGAAGNPESCDFIFDVPAVTDRYVSFDGSTEVLHQQFSYTLPTWSGNTWGTKQTTVTSTDLLTNQVTKTIYTYGPATADANVYVTQPPYSRQIPVETNVLYQDGTGKTYKEINKTWLSPHVILAEQTTLYDSSGNRNAGSATVRCYDANEQVTNAYEYGFQSEGSYPGDQNCYSSATKVGSLNNSYIGPLRRQTTTAYHPFFTWNGGTPPTWSGTHIVTAPDSVTVADGSGATAKQTLFSYDQNTLQSSGAINLTNPGTARANITTLQRLISGSTYAKTTYNYYDTGQVYTMTDPCGNTTCSDMTGSNHTTTYSYTDNYASGTGTPPGQTFAYLTQVTHPNTGVAHVENFTWGYADGTVRTHKDQNNQTISYSYTDPLLRLTQIINPDGSQTNISYNDSAPSPSIATSKKIDTSGRLLATVNVMDGLSHMVKAQLCEDGSPCTQPITTDTTFDGLGRVWKQSNPHRAAASSTDGTTIFTYDTLGRTTQVAQPDGSALNSSYSGPCTTVTDEAGKSRTSCMDGLGRLNQVTEDPGASPHLNYVTNYSYDTLDNLTGVLQNGSRQRTFSYDSLSRLTSATNPESGTITYGYDANSNLASKTSPAPNQTGSATVTLSYCYDALNRIGSKAYTNQSCPMSSPAATYTYDSASLDGHTLTNPVGRLVKNATADGKSANWNGYDQMGRISNQWQCSPLNCGATPYAKTFVNDFLGNHTSETYSYTTGTLTISYSYDNADRPTQVTSSYVDAQHPATLATIDSSVGYYPNGALRKISFANGLTETAAYNNRLQPCRMNVNSTGAYFAQCTDAVPGGNVLDFAYGFNSGTSNNGNVASWSATGLQTFNRTYSYDPLNRIASMSSPSDPTGCTGLSWTIDPWGNRTDQTVTGGTCNTFHQAVDTNNRLVGSPYQYDSAGNMTHDASHSYTFDAENRVTQVDGGSTASYVYDADGRRVWKSSGGSTTDYLYDLSDKIFAIFGPGCGGTGCWIAGAVYLNGQFLAEYASGTTYFVHKDHLGSSRLLTGLNQSICDNLDYLPFGEQLTGGTCTNLRFTGKEHDSESGLDDFGARYDSSSIGRFMSPDPLMASATVHDPQTWNRYAYALNNPLKYIDPTGMTEENAADCQKDKKCVTVKVNVIYDQKANLTDKQKEAFNKQLLQEAKDEYGDAHIHLDVSYTAGGYDDKGKIQGASKDSLNVIVSDWAPGGVTAVSEVNKEGYALTQININTAGKGDLAHEFAHDFLGDTTGLISRISKHDDSGIIGAVGNAVFDVVNDGMRQAMKNPSPYVRSSMVAPEIFNSGAKQFQQMLTQQAAIRPRQ